MTTLQEAIEHPDVNVFDIINITKNKYQVVTYPKPGETPAAYKLRHEKNLKKAAQLKSPNTNG